MDAFTDSNSWNYSKLLLCLLAPPGMVSSHIRNSKVTYYVHLHCLQNQIFTVKYNTCTGALINSNH